MFAAALVVVRAGGVGGRRFVHWTPLGWLDRIGGAVCGVLLGAMVVSVGLIAVSQAPGGERVREPTPNTRWARHLPRRARDLPGAHRLVWTAGRRALAPGPGPRGRPTRRAADRGMIDLLAAPGRRRRRGPPYPVATARALRLLGWPRLLAQLARHCQNPAAAARDAAQLPYADPDVIAELRCLADELRGSPITTRRRR